MKQEIDERTQYLLQNQSLIEDSVPKEPEMDAETADKILRAIWECLPAEERQRMAETAVDQILSGYGYGQAKELVKATPIPGIKPY